MTTEDTNENRKPHTFKKRPPRPKKRNPIELAITSWFENLPNQAKERQSVSDLIAQAPKRWTAYGPLVLLPAGSFTSAAWRAALVDLTSTPEKGDDTNLILQSLWESILSEISKAGATKLTHLAVNEGIPLHAQESNSEEAPTSTLAESENILRSPGGLRMLYGDFGPEKTLESASVDGGQAQDIDAGVGAVPTEADFARAFWVSTKQNGITQTWAPRSTMFSRGNVKEKARLLAFHDAAASTSTSTIHPSAETQLDAHPHPHRHIPEIARRNAIAVDLYGGIGYFAFSYATLGFRVFCWELNPWSVEGLRRGAGANGWSVRVVAPAPLSPSSSSFTPQEDDDMLRDVLAGNETIVVFLQDNARTKDVLRKLHRLARERQSLCGEGEDGGGGGGGGGAFSLNNVMHVNLGLLPSSQLSWSTAWEVAQESKVVWFHVHENVGVADIDAKRAEIRGAFARYALARGVGNGSDKCKGNVTDDEEDGGTGTIVCVEHVELVKTFAPGVWHCVFDVCVRRDEGGGVT
ncbi:S-adenosyl-L-methionine-dependent methyltransferase [Astrocystis sublimbata]|nr:S-adenosyl-L-methionine-dependent methyltransferase [Astrocystis sublimbata]